MTDHNVSRTFDASGLRCPMPILKAKKELQEVEVGQIL
ncbi:MAG: sulfurtransferase TusA family protein, partial [Candidatus Thorarchaeota archaeon]